MNEDPSPEIEVELNDSTAPVGDWTPRLARAVRLAAGAQGFRRGSLSIAVVTDQEIHQLNRHHLQHDYPTDVLSFGYVAEEDYVEGEIVASLDTARREAQRLGWRTDHELTLYLVHGTLHVCGLLDKTPLQRRQMRAAEQQVLKLLEIHDAARFHPDASPCPAESDSP